MGRLMRDLRTMNRNQWNQLKDRIYKSRFVVAEWGIALLVCSAVTAALIFLSAYMESM
jgi:hypothetical protein